MLGNVFVVEEIALLETGEALPGGETFLLPTQPGMKLASDASTTAETVRAVRD